MTKWKLILPIALSAAPWAAGQAKQTAEQVFKNVQVLKGIPVDDFMGTMGIMSAAVGYDCSECHANAGTDKVDWAADTQKKVIARKMTTMVQKINADNFSNRQVVTCWSCHHGRDRPATSPTLEMVYGPPSGETDDVVQPMPGQLSPEEILTKYVQALGGEQKLAAIKSYVATGTTVGFGGFGGGGKVQIYAKFPDQRAVYQQFPEALERGDAIRTYNGKVGWLMTPLTVLGEYELTGGELDGARVDALMQFPQQLKSSLTNFRTGLATTISDLPGPSSQTTNQTKEGIGQDRPVNVVQGTGPRGLLVTLYFDSNTGLLIRMVRFGKSPIGRVPTQVDFSDYRDVNGVKMPFRYTFAWLDGRDAIQISELKTNVDIDAAKFGRPVNTKKK